MAGAAGVYTGGNATVIMDSPPLVYVKVFSPGSGPDRHLKRKAESVALTAKVLAPRRSGRLATSIKVDQGRGTKGRYAFGYNVYTPIHYGFYVHEGTHTHVRETFPRTMKFPGTGRFYGKTIFTDVVVYRGRPAKPFLQQALSAMAG